MPLFNVVKYPWHKKCIFYDKSEAISLGLKSTKTFFNLKKYKICRLISCLLKLMGSPAVWNGWTPYPITF